MPETVQEVPEIEAELPEPLSDDAEIVQEKPVSIPDLTAGDSEPLAVEAPAPEPETQSEPSGLASVPEQDLPLEEAPVADEEVAETEPAPLPDVVADSAPEVSTASDPAAPRIGNAVQPLTDRTPAVPQGRLPSIVQAVPENSEDSAALPEAFSGDSPLVRFASPFTPEDDVPRMAIVLIDDGSGPMGPAELETFPFPVTFAVDPSHPNAAEVAKGYRQRGFEVLALARLPEGAEPTDVEVSLNGVLDTVPEAVGVLETPGGSLQQSREVSAQATAFLGASGHGMVMMPKGLNTAQKLALKEGVPSVSVFRDLDSDGQDQAAIRRTLDQASFRARQDGGAVMLGRIRADTVSALLLWGLQDRGNTITLVPISTILKETVEPPT
ncbi:divergent polysaccharide deacetylase family protein [Sagittula sp. SSi028]|uniref:divergent polysaccharide deacetylase family protein n=1 Tax=Sagittula sp. SSi028 TaxID=3400636 RepID=UPI003AF7F720